MRRTWEIAFLDKQRARSAAGNSIEEGLKRPKGKNGMGGGGRAKTKEERLTDPKFLTQKHTRQSIVPTIESRLQDSRLCRGKEADR